MYFDCFFFFTEVGQKLNGMEEGQVMSIEGQVNALIQQARDPARMACIFVGWQPYI
jgi:phosphatidylinositol kinase/protein kinase (PI-3  family)